MISNSILTNLNLGVKKESLKRGRIWAKLGIWEGVKNGLLREQVIEDNQRKKSVGLLRLISTIWSMVSKITGFYAWQSYFKTKTGTMYMQ